VTGRAWLFVALVLAGARDLGLGLSATTPSTAPDAAAMRGWQRFIGHAETPTERVAYELYVNPRRAALYEVTRYHVTRLWKDAEGRAQARVETEKFLWNSHPGAEHLRCFELLGDGTWVRMKTGSERYRFEMATAIHVYALHRSALGLGRP
jgi:hypothetical protein